MVRVYYYKNINGKSLERLSQVDFDQTTNLENDFITFKFGF